jgi:hypothetical protein
MSRLSRVRLLCVLIAALLPGVLLAASFGDPRGFLIGQEISEKVIHPGVKYIRADGTHLGRRMVTHIATMDTGTPGIKLQMLPGERLVTASSGQFFRRSRVSHLQQDSDALVAVNSAFFDISATMTPSGLHVQDGMILRQPSTANPSFAVTDAGLPFIASFGWSRTIRHGTGTASLQAVNANSIGDNNIVLYQYPWDRSPGRDAGFISGRDIVEVVLEKVSFTRSQTQTQRHVLRGKVLQVRVNASSVGLNSGNFVLTGTGTARSFLQQMALNSTVEVDWQLSGQPTAVDWSRITEVTSGNNLLIVNGVLRTGSGSHWETLHPRTAIGIDQSQTKVLFLLVEGRQTGRAEGMSLDSVRDYLRHMGAHNALEFDGGGSSAMAGKIGGVNTLLSTPSDGSERYVPSGLGVVAVPESPHPFFQNIRVSAEHNAAAISWETPQPAASWVLFGKEGYDSESVRNYEPSTRHTVVIHGLEPHAIYFFRMMAQSTSGLQMSHGLQFATGVEVIVDDPQATIAGTWNTGSYGVPYGSAYRWSDVVISISPTRTATYRPVLPVAGVYDLDVWYTPGANRTTAARYDIAHQTGTAQVTRSQATGGNAWSHLAGNLSFAKGTNGYARVRNDSTVGTVVIADAFRWVLRNPAPLPSGQVPDWWRQHFFGEGAPAADLDPDNDGYSLYQEYVWGTVPNDAASRPKTSIARTGSDKLRLSFSPFRKDRTYQVETSADLATWTVFNAAMQHQNGTAAVDLPIQAGTAQRYYRIRVNLP